MLTRGVAWSVALAGTLTMTVSYIDRTTLAFLAPSVTKELGISESAYGWLTSAFSIAYLIATPIAGAWIDRAGARRGLVGSVIVWSAVAALHAIVPGFWMLFALRIALGVAEAPSFPGAAQTVQRVLPPQDRSRGFGVLFTGSSIGGLIVPPLAGLLFDWWGWRMAFLGTALIGLLWLPLWIGLTSQRGVPEQMDSPPVDTRAGPRPGFRELVVHPIMVRALIAIFAVAPAIGFTLAWASKYLAREFDIKQGPAGHYLWLPPLCLDVGAILFGDLAARFRRGTEPPRALFAVGMLLTSALALLPIADSPWMATAIIGVSMAGGGALYTLCTADLLSRMPPGSASFAGGVMAGAQSLALIVMGPLVGLVVDHYHHYDGVSIFLGLWVIPGSLVWILWKPAEQLRR